MGRLHSWLNWESLICMRWVGIQLPPRGPIFTPNGSGYFGFIILFEVTTFSLWLSPSPNWWSPPAVFTSSLFTSPHNQASNSTARYKLFSYQRSPMTASWPFFLSQFFLTFLQHLESLLLLGVKSTLGFISAFSEITLCIQSGISRAPTTCQAPFEGEHQN